MTIEANRRFVVSPSEIRDWVRVTNVPKVVGGFQSIEDHEATFLNDCIRLGLIADHKGHHIRPLSRGSTLVRKMFSCGKWVFHWFDPAFGAAA
mgnify:CR=1 FL=1